MLLKLTKVGILFFSWPTWCFLSFSFFLGDLYPKRVYEPRNLEILIPFTRVEKEALLAQLAKGALNSGRMQLNHVRFRSSEPQTSPCHPPPFLVQLMHVGAALLLFLSLDMQFKQTFPSWSPNSQRKFSREQNTHLPINLQFVVLTVWLKLLPYYLLSLEYIETILHKFRFAVLLKYNMQQSMQDCL